MALCYIADRQLMVSFVFFAGVQRREEAGVQRGHQEGPQAGHQERLRRRPRLREVQGGRRGGGGRWSGAGVNQQNVDGNGPMDLQLRVLELQF